jgi:hypothetical protein
MRRMRRTIRTAALLGLALWPAMAAVSRDTVPPSRMPVAISQPLVAMSDSGPLVPITPGPREPFLSETGMLVLVGSGLLGLAAVVRRTTRDS